MLAVVGLVTVAIFLTRPRRDYSVRSRGRLLSHPPSIATTSHNFHTHSSIPYTPARGLRVAKTRHSRCHPGDADVVEETNDLYDVLLSSDNKP